MLDAIIADISHTVENQFSTGYQRRRHGPSRDARRTSMGSAMGPRRAANGGTNFETNIFKFRWFLGPSDQSELYHTPLLSKIWGLGDKILFVSEVRIEGQISIMEIWIWLPIPPWRKVLGSGSRFTYWLLSIEFGCLSHRVLPSTRSDPKITSSISSYSFWVIKYEVLNVNTQYI